MTAAQSVSYSITVRLEVKLDRMGATGARYIASSDMSCLMHVQGMCAPRPTWQVQAISDATMTIGSDTTEATDVATVRVLRLPLVDRPSSALNIQKKLLLT
jgi:hypothetical protein